MRSHNETYLFQERLSAPARMKSYFAAAFAWVGVGLESLRHFRGSDHRNHLPRLRSRFLNLDPLKILQQKLHFISRQDASEQLVRLMVEVISGGRVKRESLNLSAWMDQVGCHGNERKNSISSSANGERGGGLIWSNKVDSKRITHGNWAD